jgi:hypothetical protein
MLFREVISDYLENDAENVSTLCGNNAVCCEGLISFQEIDLHTVRFDEAAGIAQSV